MKPYVYLIGPINHVTQGEALNWRATAEALLLGQFIGLNPLRGTKAEAVFDGMGNYDHAKARLTIKSQEIVDRDLMDIRNSRAAIYNMSAGPSYGSCMELPYCRMAGVPVFGFEAPEKALTSPWIETHVT